MSIGSVARRLLGERWFPAVGRVYRGLFVDLDQVAASFPPLGAGQVILDVGGGDGELLDAVLARNPDARVTMIDIGPRLGLALRPEVAARVTRSPGTSVRDYIAAGRPPPDVAIVADVVHHIPLASRAGFLTDLRDLFAGRRGRLLVKDVEPGGARARLAFWADRYVSGDKAVRFLPAAEMKSLVASVFPGARITDTPLIERDPPNYSLIVDV